MSRIHFIGGEKGGVGKSVVARLLAQYWIDRGTPWTGFDTDRLGTFTRDVARTGSQLDAARQKAEVGLRLSGLDCAAASEGAFGAGLWGLVPTNLELVILVDRAEGVEIVGRAHGPAHQVHREVATLEALAELAHSVGFPAHGLVVRPDGEDDPRLQKGAADWAQLRAAFERAQAQSLTSRVFVESDLRAHRNPARMEVIERATRNLLQRLASECPRCGTSGFWVVELLPGLPCRECRAPTQVPRAERWACVRGDHVEVRARDGAPDADSSQCDGCNP